MGSTFKINSNEWTGFLVKWYYNKRNNGNLEGFLREFVESKICQKKITGNYGCLFVLFGFKHLQTIQSYFFQVG